MPIPISDKGIKYHKLLNFDRVNLNICMVFIQILVAVKGSLFATAVNR